MYRLLIGVLLIAQQTASNCGNNNTPSSPELTNTVPIVVNDGPTGNAANTAFITVTVCAPGQPSNCQSIDGVTVDTGSSGLRLLASAVTIPLNQEQTSGGSGMVECFPFQDGYTWGPVVTADVRLGQKQASGIPIQLIGSTGVPLPPADCRSSGMPNEDSADALGANGVLGIGLFRQDCGPACTFVGASNPGLYYACALSSCQATTASLNQQVLNPVWQFSSDNNGVTLSLPSVTGTGQPSTSGMLIFGIGTESNNGLGNAAVYTLDGFGEFSTQFGSSTVSSFLDSGSNGVYFLDSPTAGIPLCPDTSDFYCPPSTLNLSATNIGANGRSNTVPFAVADADTLIRLPDAVLPQLGGPFANVFDWGLPFFYGRTVYTAIEGQATPVGTGPYFAY